MQQKPSLLKKWLVAVRPFAFPASVVPVLVGTALAMVETNTPFKPGLFLAALMAMMALHAGANILSDIQDFKRGLDKEPTPVSGAIVRGWMTPRQALIEALVLLAAGIALGLVIVWLTTTALLIVGAIGLAIGIFYTVPPISLKYHALGDAAVFLNFGIFGALGAWMVQTRTFSWLPVVHAVPIGLLVVAILHANNWRDVASDKHAGFSTVASRLGDRGAMLYYGALVFAPFVWVTLGVVLSRPTAAPLPRSVLAVWLALPVALMCWGKARRRHAPRQPLDFVTLDGATAQLSMAFGLLYAAGLILPVILRRIG